MGFRLSITPMLDGSFYIDALIHNIEMDMILADPVFNTEGANIQIGGNTAWRLSDSESGRSIVFIPHDEHNELDFIHLYYTDEEENAVKIPVSPGFLIDVAEWATANRDVGHADIERFVWVNEPDLLEENEMNNENRQPNRPANRPANRNGQAKGQSSAEGRQRKRKTRKQRKARN